MHFYRTLIKKRNIEKLTDYLFKIAKNEINRINKLSSNGDNEIFGFDPKLYFNNEITIIVGTAPRMSTKRSINKSIFPP